MFKNRFASKSSRHSAGFSPDAEDSDDDSAEPSGDSDGERLERIKFRRLEESSDFKESHEESKREQSNNQTSSAGDSLKKTSIDCVHMKKQDKSRLQAEDSMEKYKENDYFSPFPEANFSSSDSEEKINKLKELSRLPDICQRLTRILQAFN